MGGVGLVDSDKAGSSGLVTGEGVLGGASVGRWCEVGDKAGEASPTDVGRAKVSMSRGRLVGAGKRDMRGTM